ncbi:hypothetical protein ACF0H5_023738 [Mactra antiquata]
MMTKVRCLGLIALCLCVANGNEEKTVSEKREKKFILDSFLHLSTTPTNNIHHNWQMTGTNNFISSFISTISALECEQCKCCSICTAHSFFGIDVSEKDICGDQVWNSINCAGVTKASTTTTVAPAILSNGTLVTQKPPSTVKSCDRICTIGSVARAQPMASNITSMCFSGYRSGNEALPTVCCGLKSEPQWKIGAKVIDACKAGDITYSPVAAFVNGAYVRGSAGIIVECQTNGFQLAAQTCDKAPLLTDISAHQGAYYIIEQY